MPPLFTEDQEFTLKKTKKAWAKQKKVQQAQMDRRVWIRTADEMKDPLHGVVTSISLPDIQILVEGQECLARLAPDVSSHWSKDLVIGDRVWYTLSPEGQPLIQGRAERTSSIIRMRGDRTRSSLDQHVLAANIEIGVIVASAMNPEFHPRFIDRYLAVLQDGNVSPVICLNKADLTDVRHPILDFYRRLEIPLVETSLKTGQGIDTLKSLLHGKTSVLVGQSGVGKSSLVNVIAPHVQAETGAVTEKRGTGMHTTTRSNLYQWAEHSFLIDTPGIRSLGMENIPREEIRFLFPEFARLPQACKFADCLHLKEPGCAVKQALEAKTDLIHAARYESYQRMMEETD